MIPPTNVLLPVTVILTLLVMFSKLPPPIPDAAPKPPVVVVVDQVALTLPTSVRFLTVAVFQVEAKRPWALGVSALSLIVWPPPSKQP